MSDDKVIQYSLTGAAPTIYYVYASKIQKYCEDNGINFSLENSENNLKETLCKDNRHTISFCPIDFYIKLVDFCKEAKKIKKEFDCFMGCNLSMGSHIGTFDSNNPHLYLSITFFFIMDKKVVMKWKLIPHIEDGKRVINEGIVIRNRKVSVFSYKRINKMAWKIYDGYYDHLILAPGTLFIHGLITGLKLGKFDHDHIDYVKDRAAIIKHIDQFNSKYGTTMYLSDDDKVLNTPGGLNVMCEQAVKDGVKYPYTTSCIKRMSE